MTNPIREEWTSKDGQHRILWGDCLEILPTLDTSEVAAVLADPPYGIDIGNQNLGKWRSSKMKGGEWDKVKPDLSVVLSLGLPTCIWGGNYFVLPPTRAFLVWHKGAGFTGRDFAECEIAWCSWDMNARCKVYDPLAGGDYRSKVHPTQKPLPVMQWCLSFLPPGLILDPFAGSCTVAVACARTGRRSISIEIERKYFEIGIERMEREAKRHPLLEQAKLKQLDLI